MSNHLLLVLAIGAALVGCSEDGSDGDGCLNGDPFALCGMPHTTCAPVEGGAPCCEPPDPRTFECPAGTELHVETRPDGQRGGIGCRKPGGQILTSNGPYVSFSGESWGVLAYGDLDYSVVCWPSGLMKGRVTATGETIFDAYCIEECYDEAGQPDDCLSRGEVWCADVR